MGRGFESRRDHDKRFALANLLSFNREPCTNNQHGRQLFRKAIRRLRKKTRRMGASKKIGQTTQKEENKRAIRFGHKKSEVKTSLLVAGTRVELVTSGL